MILGNGIDWNVPPQLWVLGREFARNTSKNLIKRTILFFAKGNSRYRFVNGSMGLDSDPTVSDQRIPP